MQNIMQILNTYSEILEVKLVLKSGNIFKQEISVRTCKLKAAFQQHFIL